MLEDSASKYLQPRNSWVVMPVADVGQALEFYRDKLRIPFGLVVTDETDQVTYIGSPLNLHFTSGQPYLYMVVEGSNELYKDYRSQYISIINELKFSPHMGMDQFAIQDADGNVIRFGRDVPEE